MIPLYATFEDVAYDAADYFLNNDLCPRVDVGEWHAMDVRDKPQLVTREWMNFSFRWHMPPSIGAACAACSPNLPWAEDQFQERIGGVPLNPGETYKTWPWYKPTWEHQYEGGAFSHTYMQRFWPRHAEPGAIHADTWSDDGIPNAFAGYDYGDLNDVVSLLERSPATRQAVLPVWFPSDSGAVSHQRVPCSLFYQFLLREDRLHVTYTIRSCDFVRHFRDDVYHTVRLAQWVLAQLQNRQDPRVNPDADGDMWDDVTLGLLTFHCTSFHCFEGDVPKLRREYAS